MPKRDISLDGALQQVIGESLQEPGSPPALHRVSGRLLRAAVKVALRQDLTRRQRECIVMYFSDNLTLPEIGRRLGIGKSTVYKHIETGKERIRRVVAYAQAFQEAMDEEEAEED